MAKILLLDDSPVMHRVVRLTFADDAGVEIAVVRTPPEAELALSTSQHELIIAYARFPGSVDLAYFQKIRKHCSRLLLLAESEENLEHFVAAGLKSILRKPFHSDELRLAVQELLAGDSEVSKNNVIAGRAAPTPPSSMVPPSPPPRMAMASAPASKPPPPPPSFPPVTPIPTEATAVTVPSVSAPSVGLDEPQITMDLSFFKKPAAPVVESSSGLREQVFAPESSLGTSLRPPVSEAPMVPPPRSSAGATHQQPRSIEPAPWSSEPLSLEDVMVSTRVGNSGLSRSEVEKIVEDAVAAAVSNAVRQALNETLPDLRQALVNEVSQRAVAQLSAELQSIKLTLRENMLAELRDLSAQWLRRETPSLAKDVIREEIRKVIEQL
ncbi:MAG: hypothetical protein RI932_2126 [Pseudomonadota bacterium]|jgi:DNA-binding NarL/FixJ family response regulator